MPETVTIKVTADGEMVLPLTIRTALGLEGAGMLVASIVDGEVRLTNIAKNIALAQALYRAHVVRDLSSDDFLVERRREALLENAKDQAR
jgi:bifunctional DNA-binding transcriptional regulator/antitoxin component of YhaV-PrlF toxin-antitoxin module